MAEFKELDGGVRNDLMRRAVWAAGERVGRLFDQHADGQRWKDEPAAKIVLDELWREGMLEWLRFLLLTHRAEQAGVDWRTGADGRKLDARLLVIAERGSVVLEELRNTVDGWAESQSAGVPE